MSVCVCVFLRVDLAHMPLNTSVCIGAMRSFSMWIATVRNHLWSAGEALVKKCATGEAEVLGHVLAELSSA